METHEIKVGKRLYEFVFDGNSNTRVDFYYSNTDLFNHINISTITSFLTSKFPFQRPKKVLVHETTLEMDMTLYPWQ